MNSFFPDLYCSSLLRRLKWRFIQRSALDCYQNRFHSSIYTSGLRDNSHSRNCVLNFGSFYIHRETSMESKVGKHTDTTRYPFHQKSDIIIMCCLYILIHIYMDVDVDVWSVFIPVCTIVHSVIMQNDGRNNEVKNKWFCVWWWFEFCVQAEFLCLIILQFILRSNFF